MDEYICDDRNVLDKLREIREMTDEEFEKHIAELKEKEKENENETN